MHSGLSFSPLKNITLIVLLGPKAISSTFIIIFELDIFQVKLGILLLITMDVIPSMIYKCLKFPHEGSIHVVQDIRYQPLVANRDFLLDHFWLTLVAPLLPCGDLMYRSYYQYKIGELAPK